MNAVLTIGNVLSQQFDLDSAISRQKQMEEDAVALGVKRFRAMLESARVNGQESGAGGSKKLLIEGMEKLVVALEAFINPKPTTTYQNGREGPNNEFTHPHSAMKWVKMVGPDVTAYIVVKVVLDSLSKEVDFRKAVVEIADLLRDELRYRRFQEVAPGLFQYKVDNFTTSNYAHMARSMNAAMEHLTGPNGEEMKVDVSDLEMDAREKTLLGTKLLDLALGTTGYFTIDHKRESDGTAVSESRTIKATPETLEWLQKRNSALEVLFPVNLPMVCPPLPWAPMEDGSGVARGGYRFTLARKYPMRRGLSKKGAAIAEKALMPKVYAALNRIQETPWRINTPVLDVLEAIILAGGGMAGVPKWEDYDAPEKPQNAPPEGQKCSEECAWVDFRNTCGCSEARKAYDDAWRPYRKAAHDIHEKNHERRQAKVSFENLLSVVRKMKSELAIWFPHNMDFRGRIYPLTSYLSPQGDDLCKGLLTFAQGIALGEDGRGWLLVHGANCLGKTRDGRKLSKMTLNERVEYMVSIADDLCAVAADPMATRWWSSSDDVDDPVQFLAFCLDFAGFWKLELEGRGDEYVSSLPCAMDGTCNGLQHYSAMFLDTVSAREVNVSPTERPADIYNSVAELVLGMLERDAVDNLYARLWLQSGLVNRKLTKKPTMTFTYGSVQYGFSEQIAAFIHGMKNPETMVKYEKTMALFSVTDEEHEKLMEAAKAAAKAKKEAARAGKKRRKSQAGDAEEEQEEPKKFPSKGGMRSLIGTESKPGLASQYMAGLIWEGLKGVVSAAQQGMKWLQDSARAVAASGNLVSWTVPETGLIVIQEYREEITRRVETKLAGKVYRPALAEPTNVPNTRKQASAIAPNVIHSFDAACLMLTVELASENGIEHFAMVHDSYGVRAGECAVMADCLRRAFHSFYTKRNVALELDTQFRKLTGEEQLKEYPEIPAMGTLDLAGVIVSDYFFS